MTHAPLSHYVEEGCIGKGLFRNLKERKIGLAEEATENSSDIQRG